MFKPMRYLLLLLICLTLLSTCKNEPGDTLNSRSEVRIDTFSSDVQNDKFNYHIYLPEQFNADNKYPIIYLLHGHGGHDDDWFSPEEGHVRSVLDSLINENKIPHVIAVSLDASNSWYIDRELLMETIYIREFIPFIESSYSKAGSNPFRVLVGNSAGGYGALRFGLKYPEIFQDVILLSPAAYDPAPPEISSSRKIELFKLKGRFNDSIWKSFSYVNLLPANDSILKDSNFYISTGDDDKYGIFEVITQLNSNLNNHGISVETTVVNGGHSWDVWRDRFAYDLERILKIENR